MIASTGPAGPGVAPAYGGAYNSTTVDTYYSSPITAEPIYLNASTPLEHVAFGGNSLTVELPGIYKITFYVNFSHSSVSYFEFYLTAASQQIAISLVDLNVSSRIMTSFQRSFHMYLPAGTALQGFMNNTAAGELYIPSGGAGLLVNRIGE